MIDILPNSIYQRRTKYHQHILISDIKGDKKCKQISEYVMKLEYKYLIRDNLTAIRVQWNSFKKEIKIPEYVTAYTVFYLRMGETVGYIDDPSSLDELIYFYEKCNSVSKYSKIAHEKQSSFTIENESNNSLKIDLKIPLNLEIESKMRISSPTCKIFQFNKNRKCESIYFNNIRLSENKSANGV